MTKPTRAAGSSPRQKAKQLLRQLALGQPSHTDPQGSYTGRPEHGEQPVQDADDL